MPQRIFDVVAKNPQEQHIAENMGNSAVHEHRRQQRDVHCAWRWLQAGNFERLPGNRLLFHVIGRDDIVAAYNLLRNRRKLVSKLLVFTQSLEEYKNEYIGRDEAVVHYR